MSWNKTKVRLSMGMSTGGSATGGSRHRWHIKIDDEVSGVRLLDVELTPDLFACALAHHVMSDVDAEIVDAETFTEKVGKRHDIKTIALPVGALREAEAVLEHCRDTIKPHLTDGWQLGNYLDSYNWHHFDQGRGNYRVVLHRWVDPSTPVEQAPALQPSPGKVKQPKKRKQ